MPACVECAKTFRARQWNAQFCSAACRGAFNTRRRDRGAELYDLLMSAAYGKEPATATKDLLEAYKKSDEMLRDGRRSWQPWNRAKMNMPAAGYSNETGDGR